MRENCQARYAVRDGENEYALVHTPWAAPELEECGEPAVDHPEAAGDGLEPIRTHLCARHWDQYRREEEADGGNVRAVPEGESGPDGPPPGAPGAPQPQG